MCNRRGCGHKNKLPNGKKSLAETHPEIAKIAWGWDPRTVTAGSNLFRQFRCKFGHLPKPVKIIAKVRNGPESCRICSGHEILIGYNDLATTHPETAAQAVGWDPRTVTAGCNLKKQFRCSAGHLQEPVTVYNKVRSGPNACSFCSKRKILVGFNDLLTTHPEIAKQAYGWDPRKVTSGCQKKLQFRCKFGHLPRPVEVYVKARLGPDSCRVCSGKEVLIGYNDIGTTHPEIAAIAYKWDPRTVTAGCNKKRRFICKAGHISKPVTISRKVCSGPDSCKICSGREVLAGYNDLATTHPEIATQAYGWDPRKVSAGSQEKRVFKCPFGHLSNLVTVCHKVRGGPNSNCRTCAKNGFKPHKPSFFYLVCKLGLLKIGIGNHGSGRLETHRRAGWELIESIDMSGHAADALEDACIAAFKSKGIPLGQFRETFHGSTESWYKHDLEVRTIRGLCRKLRVNLDAFLAQ